MLVRSHHLRRIVPASALEPLVQARLRWAWADPKFRRDAEAQLSHLLSGGPRADEVPGLARDWAEFSLRRKELRWHPRLITGQPVWGIEALPARRPGQGMVLNFMHQAYFEGAFASLRPYIGPIHTVVAPPFLRPSAEPWKRQLAHVIALGGSVVPADVGTTRLANLLKEGATVAIASDVKGQTPVTFLGKRFMGSSGAARIAFLTDSPVMVVTAHPDSRGRPILRLSEPLFPGEFRDPLELLGRMLELHEPAIVAWPESVYIPRTLWSPA